MVSNLLMVRLGFAHFVHAPPFHHQECFPHTARPSLSLPYCLIIHECIIKQIRRTRAKSQPIAATRLLCSLQYPVQAKSSASDLSFPIFEIAIRRLINLDIVVLANRGHPSCGTRLLLVYSYIVCQPERVDIVAFWHGF